MRELVTEYEDRRCVHMFICYPYKWKNEINGGVGMSPHEKERKNEDAYIKTGD